MRDEDFDADLARVIVTGQDGTETRYAAVDFERGIVYLPSGVTGTVTISLSRAKQAFADLSEAVVQMGKAMRQLVRNLVGEVVDRMRLQGAIHAHAYWHRFSRKNMIHVCDYDRGHIWSFDPNKRIIVQAAAFASQRHQRQERVNHVDRANWKRRQYIQQLRKKHG